MRPLAVVTAFLLMFSSTVWTASPPFVGNLRASGIVLTNSVPMPDGGTVRAGDFISTRTGALAIITAAGHGRVEVRSDSEAQLASDRLILARGAVASDRLAIETGSYTIRPQNANSAWFAVASRDGRLLVAAHRGSVLIASAAAPPVVVNEGSIAQQDQNAPQNQEQAQAPPAEQEKGKKKKRAAAAAASGGWAIGSLSHAASIALIVGAGAAVAGTAAGVAVSLSNEGPSPSR